MSGKRYDFMGSSSSDDSISASFFIKKDPSQEEKENANGDDDDVNLSIKSMKKLKQASKLNKIKVSSAKNSFFSDLGTSKPMDAISRFAQLENQIKARSQNHAKLLQSLSDLDISSDDDIKNDLAQLKQGKASSKYHPAGGDKESSSDSSSIQNADEFIKTSNVGQMPSPIESKDPPKLTSVMKKRRNDSKITKSVSFDLGDSRYDDDSDDEDSLNSFMQTSSVPTSSLEEIIDSKLQNIMSLDDLLPVLGNSDVESSSKELENNGRPLDQLELSATEQSSRRTSSISSVVGTGSSVASSRSSGRQTNNIRTMDDLMLSAPTSTSTSKRRKNKKQAKKSKKNKVANEESVASVKTSSLPDVTSDASAIQEDDDDQYSAAEQSLVSRSDTLKDTESIASEIHEEGSWKEVSSEDDSTTTTYSSVADVADDYSSNFTTTTQATTTQATSASITRSSVSKKKKKVKATSGVKKKGTATSGVQTDPIGIQPNQSNRIPAELLSSFPSSIVNPWLLSSPSVFGLQDVLKQQVLLTREYIHRSNSLYDYGQRSLTANHHYTTLAGAQELINQHRRKLNLAVYTT